MNQIDKLMGDGYLDILKGKYGLDVKKSEEKIVKEKDDPLGFDEGDVGETIATEIETVTPIADSLPDDKLRPGGAEDIGDFGNAKARIWDRKYGARYNPDGTPIIVEPRPTDPEATTMRLSGFSNREKSVNAIEEWDRKYKKTHNPDGTPMKLKGD